MCKAMDRKREKRSHKFVKMKSLLFRMIAVFIGLLLALLILEVTLQVCGLFLTGDGVPQDVAERDKTLLLFSGDSWTAGCDAEPGNSFFELLKKDKSLEHYSLVNLGYPSSNYFQIVEKVINYGKVPGTVVLNGGVNSWHLLGLEKFAKTAEAYLSRGELETFRKRFKMKGGIKKYMKRLKLYKVCCYLSSQEEAEIDLEALDRKFESEVFFDHFYRFHDTYQSWDAMLQALPVFLKDIKELTLDQKFYFVAYCTGFDAEKMEEVLKKMDAFYPEKLTLVPYETYKEIHDIRREAGDVRSDIIEWSLTVLSRWAAEKSVRVIIQTYPDIKREGMGKYDFPKINELIKCHALRNGLEVIDHNIQGIEWPKLRTSWHVGTIGHHEMKRNILNHLVPSETQN